MIDALSGYGYALALKKASQTLRIIVSCLYDGLQWVRLVCRDYILSP